MNFEIKKGQARHGKKIFLYGVEGVGKSSAGLEMPKPLFLCAEDGLVGPQFDDAQHFSPKSWQDVLDFCAWFIAQKDYDSLIVDTLDWLEKALFSHIVIASGNIDIKDIEDFGFGKGYAKAETEFTKIVSIFDKIAANGKNILVLAHSHIKPFSNPMGENYDRFEPKAYKKISSLMKEWADAVLFARFDDHAANKKASGSGLRIVHAEHSSAWDAKNRHGLPKILPLDMAKILEHMDSSKIDKKKLEAELLELVSEEKKEAVKKWLATNPTTHAVNAAINKWRSENA